MYKNIHTNYKMFLFPKSIFILIIFHRMATTRALIYFIQRRHLLPCTVQMATRKTNCFFPIYTSHTSYSDKSITKSDQKESGEQVQVGFAEVGKSQFYYPLNFQNS